MAGSEKRTITEHLVNISGALDIAPCKPDVFEATYEEVSSGD